jgi:hypothetical protein
VTESDRGITGNLEFKRVPCSHAQRDKKIGTTPSPQWTFSESVQILTSMRLETPSPVLTATCDNITVIAVTQNFEGRYNYSEDEMNREENQRLAKVLCGFGKTAQFTQAACAWP